MLSSSAPRQRTRSGWRRSRASAEGVGLRRAIVTVVGLALFVAAIFVFCSALGDLLDTGTCAAGNQPYVIGRECPEGTGTSILLLFVSTLGLLVSFLVIALGGGGPDGLSSFMWGAFFTAVGAYAIVHVRTSEVIAADGRLGGMIVGIVFVLIGLPALVWFGYRLATRDRGGAMAGAVDAGSVRDGGRTAPSAGGSPVWSRPRKRPHHDLDPGVERITAIERLQRLRESGALTEAEFESEKERILGS